MNSVKKFEFEIDSIFERVYTVNESLSSLERNALIKGFEDGLNEGFGSWFGGALGKTVNFFKGVPDKLKSWYDTGKKYAAKAWDWIKDLASKIANGIKNGFNTALNWCTTNFKKFSEWITSTYYTAIEGIKSAWQKFKGKIADFSEWCLDLWSKLVENVKNLYQKTKEKLLALGSKISEWVSNAWEKIKEIAEKAKNSTIAAFKRLGEIVSNALSAGLKKAGEIASAALLICLWPFAKLIELVKKVPSLWQKLVKIVSDYIQSEIADFKRAYGEEMERYRLSKNPPKPPVNNDEPNVDLNLPEIDDTEMSDEEAENRLAEIKRRYADKMARRNEGYTNKLRNIKNFRNF